MTIQDRLAKSTDHQEILFFETLDKDKEVETSEEEDETTEDDAEDETEEETDDDTEDEDEPESDDDKSETDDDEDSETDAEFDKRFTQLKGETLTEYKDSLETAYAESTKEGIRLKELVDKATPGLEALSKIIAKHPELAQEVGEVAKTTEFPENPTQTILEQQIKDTQQKEYSEFNKQLKDDGVDLEADPALAQELNTALAVVRDHVWRNEHRIIGMGEGLTRAWKLMGKQVDSKDNLRNAAKKVGGQKRTAGGKKVKAEGTLTDAQRQVAEKFGLDPKKVARHVTN